MVQGRRSLNAEEIEVKNSAETHSGPDWRVSLASLLPCDDS